MQSRGINKLSPVIIFTGRFKLKRLLVLLFFILPTLLYADSTFVWRAEYHYKGIYPAKDSTLYLGDNTHRWEIYSNNLFSKYIYADSLYVNTIHSLYDTIVVLCDNFGVISNAEILDSASSDSGRISLLILSNIDNKNSAGLVSLLGRYDRTFPGHQGLVGYAYDTLSDTGNIYGVYGIAETETQPGKHQTLYGGYFKTYDCGWGKHIGVYGYAQSQNNDSLTCGVYGEAHSWGANKQEIGVYGRGDVGVWSDGKTVLGIGQVASSSTIDPDTSTIVKVTGTSDIDSIIPGHPGQLLILKFESTASSNGVVKGKNLKISSTFAYTPDDVLELFSDGTYWYEISRSQN